ncbi:MAG: glycerol acyltransferase, partial [Myxococcota bacterium]
ITLADLKPLARLLGMPAFPITPTWPLLGPLGLIPYPSRYAIEFGEPMHFRGNPDDEDHVIERKVNQVKAKIAKMLDGGRRRRKSIYF